VDKLTYAALESTLLAYVRHDLDSIPALRMMQLLPQEIQQRAQGIAHSLNGVKDLKLEVIAGESVIGVGAAPGARLATFVLAVSCRGMSANERAQTLRLTEPLPIIARVEEGRVLLDLRTAFPEQDANLANALRAIAKQSGSTR